MVSFTIMSFLAIVQLAMSRPSASPAFQVTNLDIFEPTGRPDDNSPYRVTFNVADPNDSSRAFCETYWAYADRDGGFPQTYLANCTQPSYSFKFVDWVLYDNFKLDVKHVTKKNGKKTTKQARGMVDYDIISCGHSGSGFSSCQQREGVAFPLPVYSVRKQ